MKYHLGCEFHEEAFLQKKKKNFFNFSTRSTLWRGDKFSGLLGKKKCDKFSIECLFFMFDISRCHRRKFRPFCMIISSSFRAGQNIYLRILSVVILDLSLKKLIETKELFLFPCGIFIGVPESTVGTKV